MTSEEKVAEKCMTDKEMRRRVYKDSKTMHKR